MIKSRSAFVNADDIRLHYLEWDPQVIHQMQELPESNQLADPSHDDIPLVMLHGLGATAHTWSLVADHLYQEHLIIAFDLRGHGESEQPDQGYDMVTIAEDVISGMAALGLGKVALIGHGWGARIALVTAARHPALISHLILIDCPHIEPRLWPGMTRERFIREKEAMAIYASQAAFIEAMKDEMAAFWSPEVEAIVKTYVQELPDGRAEVRLRAKHQRQIRESFWDERALPYYGKVSCPVLLVPAAAKPQPNDELPERLESADEFAAAKGYIADQVARTIHRCSVLWMPETVHDIQLQRPHVLAEHIASFVARHY